jgi:hypothetical protein
MENNSMLKVCENNREFIETMLKRETVKLFIGVVVILLYLRMLFVLITRRKLFGNVFYNFLIVNGTAAKYFKIDFY